MWRRKRAQWYRYPLLVTASSLPLWSLLTADGAQCRVRAQNSAPSADFLFLQFLRQRHSLFGTTLLSIVTIDFCPRTQTVRCQVWLLRRHWTCSLSCCCPASSSVAQKPDGQRGTGTADSEPTHPSPVGRQNECRSLLRFATANAVSVGRLSTYSLPPQFNLYRCSECIH